jgi:hypothetical protein
VREEGEASGREEGQGLPQEVEEGAMSWKYLTFCVSVVAVCMLLSARSAAAEEILEFSATPSTTQAGGHPDIRIIQKVTPVSFVIGERYEDARRFITHLPTGVIGNPHVIPTCSLDDFSLSLCSSDAQVGFVRVPLGTAPIYNLEPRPDQAGLLGFLAVGTQQYVEISARTDSDYGLSSINSPIFHLLPTNSVTVDLWGVPADPSHDALRCVSPCGTKGLGAKSNVAPEPFLSNPTACGVPLTSTLEVEFYTHVVDTADGAWPPTTGCDQLAFNPSLTVKPTTAEGDTASGLDADLRVPQIANPYTPSPSQIRAATVTLPEGFSINPNAADGKAACSEAETAIGTLLGATCPQFSKVGTLSIDSSALPGPIPGGIYLGEPKPGDPYRLILAADGFGTHVKLAGSAHADPRTGRIEVSFVDLPQSPLTQFNMHFFGSERGLLATPTHCGSYPVEAEFEPWDSVLPNQSSTSFFNVTSGPGGTPCPSGARPFGPKLTAGSLNPTAGRYTPFNLELARSDGEQNLTGLTVSTPRGFSGSLRGISYCPEAALAQLALGGGSGILERAEPTCPAESQIGTATAGAGAGSHPLYTPGKVYLAGPYKRSPLSLVVVIPAVSGPYDLGNVAVRAAINVDPVTARVTTISDSLPQILEGIPLRIRSIRVELNRPDFALNPTNCDPLSTDATITGNEGGVAALSSHFQVGNCAILPFEPKLSLTLSGGLNRRGHPAVKAVLKAQEGEANLRSTSVALPKGELLDNSHIGTICTRVQFAADNCPDGSLLGEAEAITPLLDQPLRGKVYLRSSNHNLPDLVADLKGQIDIELAGRIDTINGGSLRTSFEAVPDAPVTQFTLNLAGGSKGLLINSKGLCGKPKKAVVKMVGQNGATLNTKTKLNAKCNARARHKRHSSKRKAG